MRVIPLLVTLIHGMWLALLCCNEQRAEAHADMNTADTRAPETGAAWSLD